MQGCRRWIAGRRGGGVTGGRERGTGWAWLAKEHLAYRHTATQLCGTHSMGSLHRFVCGGGGVFTILDNLLHESYFMPFFVNLLLIELLVLFLRCSPR